MYDTKMKMSIQEVSLLEEISDDQLAIAEVYICCEGKTENEVSFDKKSIEQAIPTLIINFLLPDIEIMILKGMKKINKYSAFSQKITMLDLRKKMESYF